ncbi:MAG: hypothetical protein H6613_02965 [Ignavibacteriales bacterium]|nr:hypothetical protein [Ignavibacteriales bacterium]
MDWNPDGDKYKFSIERMNATLNCNIVYPVYTQKQYIRHSAPGRWWDCLYMGFWFYRNGLSSDKYSTCNRKFKCLCTRTRIAICIYSSWYMVPTQHYLFLELWNKTQSKDILEYFYPRLKQYHEFMAGRLGSSTTEY